MLAIGVLGIFALLERLCSGQSGLHIILEHFCQMNGVAIRRDSFHQYKNGLLAGPAGNQTYTHPPLLSFMICSAVTYLHR